MVFPTPPGPQQITTGRPAATSTSEGPGTFIGATRRSATRCHGRGRRRALAARSDRSIRSRCAGRAVGGGAAPGRAARPAGWPARDVGAERPGPRRVLELGRIEGHPRPVGSLRGAHRERGSASSRSLITTGPRWVPAFSAAARGLDGLAHRQLLGQADQQDPAPCRVLEQLVDLDGLVPHGAAARRLDQPASRGEKRDRVPGGRGVDDDEVGHARPLELFDLAQDEHVADAGDGGRDDVEHAGGHDALRDPVEAVIGQVLEQRIVGGEAAPADRMGGVEKAPTPRSRRRGVVRRRTRCPAGPRARPAVPRVPHPTPCEPAPPRSSSCRRPPCRRR